jgi:hypothetical protein
MRTQDRTCEKEHATARLVANHEQVALGKQNPDPAAAAAGRSRLTHNFRPVPLLMRVCPEFHFYSCLTPEERHVPATAGQLHTRHACPCAVLEGTIALERAAAPAAITAGSLQERKRM